MKSLIFPLFCVFIATGASLAACVNLSDQKTTTEEIQQACAVAAPLAAIAGTNLATPQGYLGVAATAFCASPTADAASLAWLEQVNVGLQTALKAKIA